MAAACLRRWRLASNELKTALATMGEWPPEIIKRSDAAQGFVVLAKQWVVERTFAQLGRKRMNATQLK